MQSAKYKKIKNKAKIKIKIKTLKLKLQTTNAVIIHNTCGSHLDVSLLLRTLFTGSKEQSKGIDNSS